MSSQSHTLPFFKKWYSSHLEGSTHQTLRYAHNLRHRFSRISRTCFLLQCLCLLNSYSALALGTLLSQSHRAKWTVLRNLSPFPNHFPICTGEIIKKVSSCSAEVNHWEWKKGKNLQINSSQEICFQSTDYGCKLLSHTEQIVFLNLLWFLSLI